MTLGASAVIVGVLCVMHGLVTAAFGPSVHRPLAASDCHTHRFDWSGVSVGTSDVELVGDWTCMTTGEVVEHGAWIGREPDGYLRAIPRRRPPLPSTVVIVPAGLACEPPEEPCCRGTHDAVVRAGDVENVFICPSPFPRDLRTGDQPVHAHSGAEGDVVSAWAHDFVRPWGTMMALARRMFGEGGTSFRSSGCE